VSAPALSIVVTGRHDNYGGDFNERFFRALRFNHARLSERGVDFELVLVEWDPVPGRPYLCDLVAAAVPEMPAGRIRRFVVAPEYQAAMVQNPRVGYMEYVAKNVGIRRADAPLVLATNTDILLGREVVDALAARRIEPGTLYRAARYDIHLGRDQSHFSWDLLEDPANHARRPVLRPPLFSGGSGDFALLDRESFHALRGYNEAYRAVKVGLDLNFLVKAFGAGYPLADIGGPVYHINHVGSFRISKSMYRDQPAAAPWGSDRWHSRFVVYDNREDWGLAKAPARALSGGTTYLDFDWTAVPPLIELRRIVLPLRRSPLFGTLRTP
jgi:hypothetical protein